MTKKQTDFIALIIMLLFTGAISVVAFFTVFTKQQNNRDFFVTCVHKTENQEWCYEQVQLQK